jgi:hypothetical protein
MIAIAAACSMSRLLTFWLLLPPNRWLPASRSTKGPQLD